MTHSGGKPHRVGDEGQRYEVTYWDPECFLRLPFGWSETMEGVNFMMRAIEAHPSWTEPKYRDRGTSRAN